MRLYLIRFLFGFFWVFWGPAKRRIWRDVCCANGKCGWQDRAVLYPPCEVKISQNWEYVASEQDFYSN
jgi:hypothetical protein